MKKITLNIIASFLYVGLSAQTEETVSIEAGYSNEVFYSLKDGEISSEARLGWDIAFKVSPSGSSILTNGAMGTELYTYPNGDTSNWSSVDTAGIKSWDLLHNSDTTWDVGAFSRTKNGFDLGWGNYSLITHYVVADSLFVIKLANGSYKKVWIDKLVSKVYYFKYANLDGSNEVADTIRKSDYSDKNFGYYSLQAEEELDREPNNNSWDLLFTKYVRNSPSVYGVTGVLGNIGVRISDIRGKESDNVELGDSAFSENISTIGYDWKSYSGGYVIEDSIAYLIQDLNNDFYKVVFTGFGGSSTGDFVFTKQKISTVGIEEKVNVFNMGIYPNPASNFTNIVFSQSDRSDVELTLYNLTGAVIYNQKLINTHPGINRLQLNLDGYVKGMYIISLSSHNHNLKQRMIIK